MAASLRRAMCGCGLGLEVCWSHKVCSSELGPCGAVCIARTIRGANIAFVVVYLPINGTFVLG